MLRLASAGDDYALVCASEDGPALAAAAARLGVPSAVAGAFTAAPGLVVRVDGVLIEPGQLGWRHR
jgi:thiamine monophosphate kinase